MLTGNRGFRAQITQGEKYKKLYKNVSTTKGNAGSLHVILGRTADFAELVFLEILNLPGDYLVGWFPERGLCGRVEIYYSVNFTSH